MAKVTCTGMMHNGAFHKKYEDALEEGKKIFESKKKKMRESEKLQGL